MVRAGGRKSGEGGKPAVKVQAVKVDQVRWSMLDRFLQLLSEARISILVEDIGLSRHDAPRMITKLACERIIRSDRHGIHHAEKFSTQCLGSSRQRRGIGLVISS